LARVQFKRPRVKRVRPPRPVPPPKPPRPRRGTLKNIYKDLITTDRDQRVETLKKAMHWYEELQAYLAYNSEWTLTQTKAKSHAERARLFGLESNKDEAKEKHYIFAIQQYEKMTRKFHPPKIGTFLSKYSHVRSKLEKRKHRFVRKFGEFLVLVDKAVRPKNYDGKRIELRVDKITCEYRIDSEGNITFDRKFLDAARKLSRTHGLLPALIKLFPVLTEAAALTMEVDNDGHKTGRYVIHGSKRHKALLEMLHSLMQYCLLDNSPKRLVRRHKSSPSTEETVAA